jgi:hypothetical protein
MWPCLFLVVGVFLGYLVTLYAIPDSPRRCSEPPTQSGETWIVRNGLIALLFFILFDAIVFHSGAYNAIFSPTGAAGTVALFAEYEAKREFSGKREILVLGDSRFAQGFSAQLADKLASEKGFKFISLAIPAANPRLWFLLLREVDPSASRYYAIVIPRVFDDVHVVGNWADKTRDIPMAAPLLRYADAYIFSASFQERQNKYRAFIACLLRGSAFQADLFDLLRHPGARLKSLRERSAILQAHYESTGSEANMVGLSYDRVSRRLTFPPGLLAMQRAAIEESIAEPKEDRPERRRDWTDRILSRYAQSPTRLISVPIPRGPLGPVVSRTGYSEAVAQGLARNGDVVMEDDLFDFIEAPEFYADGFHPNARGRERLTERLVNELTKRLLQEPPNARGVSSY